MLQPHELRLASEILPFLRDPTTPIARDFIAQASLVRLPAGATIFAEGDECSAFAVLADGQVRVFKIGETGREITLYRFGRGESCILTTSCVLSQRNFPAIATVERDATAFIIDQATFRNWIDRYSPWRDYVFQLLSYRLATVMAIVDEIAFRRVDVRLAEFLLKHAQGDPPTISATHQQIATELGTSREVVSRILADFNDNGLIRSSRGQIIVRDSEGLRRYRGVAL
ncbi:Crp/Fnr family transcriptional regulator [uncultured Chloroflexus sp.]|uniref:Crp/Fnr family transcriptional regulator n=1 Tax=uncultured Chloroflexus sp. TaxID=214040 RepID=UPI002638D6CF|nr:Crp/Fnr family transcriptional regulator [uncultured Chloroflexus sp.]